MTSLADLIHQHQIEHSLVHLEARESLGGWQAIAKYRDKLTGPWGVGCDPDMAEALTKALIAGSTFADDPDFRQVRKWHDAARPAIQQTEDFDDILG